MNNSLYAELVVGAGGADGARAGAEREASPAAAEVDVLRAKLMREAWASDPEVLRDRERVRSLLREIVAREGMPVHLIEELMRDIYGFGPITDLMADPGVTDIWIDRYDFIRYEKDGRIHTWRRTFTSEEHLRRFVVRMAASVGRKVDEARPVEDFRLPDGSRAVVFLDGPSVRGTSVVIRRFSRLFTLEELAERKVFPAEMVRLFKLMVKARLNIFAAGGMGSGKNTFLNALLLCVGPDERLVFIEDPAETRVGLPDPNRPKLPVPWAVVLEPRRAGVEGSGEVSQDLLFEKVLRTKPARVICSECRNEVTTYWTLQAMNIGHPGSMSTVHADGPEEVPARLSDMLAAYRGGAYSTLASRAGKVAAAEVIFFLAQVNGHRRLLDIAEVRRRDFDSLPEVVPLYTFRIEGYAEDGAPLGGLKPTGEAPDFLRKRKLSLYLTPEELEELRGWFPCSQH
ncbi:CpaF family protein [Desulfovirgula thermocuniculi]|uniref:CpaF family protein n=1 Tax=Desulfovirgula thermocuniculi TaxID=348842 RepID=UPI0003F98669|nr:ATPase, T2SS/T4P/T4SS family [Desulfovirgula thermocuniculi]